MSSTLRPYLTLPRAVYVLCLGTFVNRAGTLVVPFMTLYLREQLHQSIQFATFAMGALGLGAVSAGLVGGHLADLFGRRIIMLTALIGSAAILIGLSFVKAPTAFLVGIALFAFVGDMYRPAASAMIGDLVEPARRPHAFGMMYVAINLGFAVGPLVAGALAKYSFRYLFWGDAVTSWAYALIIYGAIRETLPAKTASPVELANHADLSVGRDVGARQAFAHILRDHVFLLFCLGLFCTGLVFMQSMSTFPLYLETRFGIDAATYGRIIALNGMMIVVLQIPITLLLARYNRATVLAAAAAVIGFGFGLKTLASTPWQFAGTVAVWTLGEIMQAPLVSAIGTDLAPASMRARYMGMLSFSFSGANMIGAPIGGYILSHFPGRTIWAASAATSLVAFAVFAMIHGRLTPRRPDASLAPGA